MLKNSCVVGPATIAPDNRSTKLTKMMGEVASMRQAVISETVIGNGSEDGKFCALIPPGLLQPRSQRAVRSGCGASCPPSTPPILWLTDPHCTPTNESTNVARWSRSRQPNT